jgi:TolB-like protein
LTDVFISYARDTEADAQRVSAALRAAGYDVWIDDQLPAHRPYGDVIEERLREAKAVLVLWSAAAAKSEWVRAEADVAREAHKLVQLRLGAVTLPLPFDQIHCAELIGWKGDAGHGGWAKALASIAALVTGATASAPKAASPRPAGGPVLAVLAFDNLSGDAEMQYFSDGVSEEILQTVAQTTDIKVIGRSSSFQFRGTDKAARRVAAELGASHILDGAVRRSGTRVRVSAQLIDCETQMTLWSDRFDRELADIFVLQDEIAAAIANSLKAEFAPSRQKDAIDPAAYDLYLRARTQSPGRDGAFNVGLLRQAVARAPSFVQAWSVLAYTLSNQARYAGDAEVQALHAEVRKAAERALELDPSAGIAHAALGFLCPPCGAYGQWEASLARALEAAPHDPLVLYQCSLEHSWVGRGSEALAFIDQVRDLDPLYAQGVNWRAVMLDATGHPEQARSAYLDARGRWPEFEFLFANATHFACRTGDWDWVDEMADEMARLGVRTPLVRRMAEVVAMRRAPPAERIATMQAILDRELQSTGSVATSQLSLAASVGAVDVAFDAIEKASFEHLFRPGAHLPSRDISVHCLFNRDSEPLRQDPRFVRLCDRLGLVAHWVASDRWPDCAKDECRRLADGVTDRRT